MDTLDLSSLDKALTSLEQAVTRSQKKPDDDMIRDSVILRFEYTYNFRYQSRPLSTLIPWSSLLQVSESASFDSDTVEQLYGIRVRKALTLTPVFQIST